MRFRVRIRMRYELRAYLLVNAFWRHDDDGDDNYGDVHLFDLLLC